MGVAISTPNYRVREDQLLFPNEILYRIGSFIPARDLLWASLVSRSWHAFVASNGRDFLGDKIGVACSGSELRLHQLANHYHQNDHLPPRIAAFFLENVELTRHPWSLRFWDSSDVITRLELTETAILARRGVDGVDSNFAIGCPNLRKLALRRMGKTFMMGADYLQIHEILCLNGLEELDLSDNSCLNDRIIFSILLKTEKLRSLDISKCSFCLAKAIHNRFYPVKRGENYIPASKIPADNLLEYSDYIFSFETLVNHFLLTERGACMKEINFKASTLTTYTLDLILDPGHFSWESLDISYCRELKLPHVVKFLSAHSAKLRKLCLKSDGRGVPANKLMKEVTLPQLEHLALRYCHFEEDEMAALGNYPGLRMFTCEDSTYARNASMTVRNEVFGKFKNLTELNLRNASLVDDNLVQVVIRNMKSLKKLVLSSCGISNQGLTGTDPYSQPTIDDLSDLGIDIPSWICSTRPDKEKPPQQLLTIIDDGTFPQKMSDETFRRLRLVDWVCLDELKYLEVLDLSGCTGLSCTTWHFALKLPRLYNLDLSNCPLLSLNSLGVICANCPALEYLTVVKTNPQVSLPCFVAFVGNSLPRLRRFVV